MVIPPLTLYRAFPTLTQIVSLVAVGIRDKVAAGRYRGARAFVADVQFMLSKLTSKKGGDAAELKAELTAFFTTFSRK